MDSSKDAKVAQLVSMLGMDETTALSLLEAMDWNLEAAVAMQLDDGGPGVGGAAAGPADPMGFERERAQREDSGKRRRVENPPELGPDGVRAPIAPKMDCLLPSGPAHLYDPFGGAYSGSMMGSGVAMGGARRLRPRRSQAITNDPFRDFQAEIAGAAVGYDVDDAGSAPVSSAASRLSQLFAPPLDLIHQGDLEMARSDGTTLHKWILVSIQKNDVFECQKVNRDIFRDETIRNLINASFVLWQRSHDSSHGVGYIRDYRLDGFPHLAVLDPRTLKRLRIFPPASYATASAFTEQLLQFLETHTLDSEGGGAVRNSSGNSTGAREEDEMIANAVRESLRELASKTSKSNVNVVDDVDSEDEFFLATSGSDDDEAETNKPDRSETEPRHPIDDSSVDSGVGESESITIGSSSPSPTTAAAAAAPAVESVAVEVEERDEPPKELQGVVQIRFTFPDNSRITRRFYPDEPVARLAQFAESHGYATSDYELKFSFPQKAISSLDQTATLQAAGLSKESVHVQSVSD
eukprot:m.88880 g.88880  ORF g.88880 m.88880 type:complete len:523 (+) comp11683_c0_seq1:83-1651(+)